MEVEEESWNNRHMIYISHLLSIYLLNGLFQYTPSTEQNCRFFDNETWQFLIPIKKCSNISRCGEVIEKQQSVTLSHNKSLSKVDLIFAALDR